MLDRGFQRSDLFRCLIIIMTIVLSVSLAQAQRPPRPAKPTATQVTHDSITIAWDDAPNALFYLVFLKGEGWSDALNRSSHIFTGLRSKKKYTIRIRYIEKDSFALSKYSGKLTVKTKKNIPPAPILSIDIRATLIDSRLKPGNKAFVFDFSPTPGAAEYQFYQTGGHPMLFLKSPADLDALELVRAPGETVAIFLDAFDADGNKIAAGSVTVTFPTN